MMTVMLGLRDRLQAQRNRIAIGCVLLAVIYFMLAFGDQAWRARELQAEVDQQRAEIAALDLENRVLQAQLLRYESGGYDDYVAARARRDLNLANPGETVVLVRWEEPAPAPAAPTAAPPAEERKPNWRRWIDAFSPG